MDRIKLLLVPMVLVTACFSGAFGDEARTQMSAYVNIERTFSIEVDNNVLDFGLLRGGETVYLNETGAFNNVRCVSNKGTQWFMKIMAYGEIRGGSSEKPIPPSNIEFQVVSSTGSGSAAPGWQAMSSSRVTAYTASGNDLTGSEVLISLQYRLNVPADSAAGHYTFTVHYMLTEDL